MMSPYKRAHVKQGFILGALAGLFLFIFLFLVGGHWFYVFFIPLASAMCAGAQYVKDDPEDEGIEEYEE